MATQSGGILIVDDDEVTLNRTMRWLRTSGYSTTGASTFDLARRLIENQSFDLMITKPRVGPANGVRLMQLVRFEHPQTAVILLGTQPDAMLEIEARRYGALYAIEPASREALVAIVARVAAHLRPQQRWPRKRLPARLPVHVRDDVGSLVDVSYGGLCFEVNATEALPPSYDVRLDCFGFQVRAQTIWSARVEDRVRCGAMLLTPQPGDHVRWRMLVDLIPTESREAPATRRV